MHTHMRVPLKATYRNDADDVYSFFESKHKGHYKVSIMYHSTS